MPSGKPSGEDAGIALECWDMRAVLGGRCDREGERAGGCLAGVCVGEVGPGGGGG